MTYIPRAVCMSCRVEMRPAKNGVILQANTESGPYYKVAADLVECPECHVQVAIGFGKDVVAFHTQPTFIHYRSHAEFALV